MWPHVSLISFCGVLTFVTKAAEIQSLRQIVSAELGTTVSLQCSCPEKVSLLYWYKQCFGMRPQLLVTVPKYGFAEFYGEFKDNPRVTVGRNTGIANLRILNTIPSDTAVYYCAQFNAGVMHFGEGTLLILPDAGCSNHTILQMPMSYQGHLGDSVNFQCTVYTSVSNGEHSVYWFRHGSGESHPGIIYTHGNRSDQCKSSSETDSSTQSCVYKLPKRNLSLSDAGTYYCAVAACGQILFGNGSSLKVEGESCQENHLLVYSLSATLAVFLVLIVVFLVIPINKRKVICCQKCRESSSRSNNEPSTKTNVQGEHEEDADTLNYAALNIVKKKVKGRRETKPNETVVVYSSVRCQKP